MVEITSLQTEQRDPKTTDLDDLSTRGLLSLMNKRDNDVLLAVQRCLCSLAMAVDRTYPRIADGGRLIYMGAGSSGRMGVLDAAEIPPTFSASHDQFIGLIAGGENAIRVPQEGAEDNPTLAINDLKNIGLKSTDTVIGIAASGRTPYVIAGIDYARSIGALTIGLACVSPAAMDPDIMINAVTGPELITGSTRLKAGTATKMVLNMLSTSIMIKCGKTYGNLMVDLRPTNDKLRSRAKNIFRSICTPDEYPEFGDDEALNQLFTSCGGNVKLSILVACTGLPVESAADLLRSKDGILKQALDDSAALLSAPGVSEENADAPNVTRNLVVAVDGGGTKTAAVITTKNGRQYCGFSGPSNMATTSSAEVVRSVSQAILAALRCHDEELGLRIRRRSFDGRFDRVWIGLAGAISSSPKIKHEVLSRFQKLFNLYQENELMLTGDATLLASIMETPAADGVKTCMALIAGTGAASVVFEKTENARGFTEFSLVDKLGGFGPVFGDSGAGYDVGSRAIKATLRALDVARIKDADYEGELSLLNKQVIKAFGCDYEDFLSGLLNSVRETSKVSRIASIAKVVFELAFLQNDEESLQIISLCADEMLHYVIPFVQYRLKAEDTVLVLGGSVFKHTGYETLLLDKLEQKGIRFRSVVIPGDAASVASKALLNK